MNSWYAGAEKKPLGREKAKTQTVHYVLLFQSRLLTAQPLNTLAHEHGFMHNKQTLCQLLKQYCDSVIQCNITSDCCVVHVYIYIYITIFIFDIGQILVTPQHCQ